MWKVVDILLSWFLFWFINHEMQITSLYGGPLEFHFVVESTDDPAYHALNRLLADFKVYIAQPIPFVIWQFSRLYSSCLWLCKGLSYGEKAKLSYHVFMH